MIEEEVRPHLLCLELAVGDIFCRAVSHSEAARMTNFDISMLPVPVRDVTSVNTCGRYE